MKPLRILVVVSLAVLSLVLSGCPIAGSVGGTDISQYESAARVIENAAGEIIFVEDDGSEIPVIANLNGNPDGPVELIDYAVLDDGMDVARSSSAGVRVRCIVVGRRSDGRSGVWVIYRHFGVTVIPNEDGIEDSALMELVELQGSPWQSSDWVYDAKAISDDGMMIIGQLSRPEGWKYDEYLGEVPEPEIGVWWNIYYKDDRLVVSRARPILLMDEPKPVNARFQSRGWFRNWLEYIIEWFQSNILKLAWNYLTDATEFVDISSLSDFDGVVFQYTVAGPDKYGVASHALLTRRSVENILEAPGGGTDTNEPPWPITGPVAVGGVDPRYSHSVGIILEITSDSGVVTNPAFFDPDQDPVLFVVEPVAGSMSDGTTPPPASVSQDGVFKLDDWSSSYLYMKAEYSITITNDIGEDLWTRSSPEPFLLKLLFIP